MRYMRDIMFMLTGIAVTCAFYKFKDPVMNKFIVLSDEDCLE